MRKFQNWLMIRLVPSFKLKRKYLYVYFFLKLGCTPDASKSLFATSILNERKMRPLHSAFQIIRFYCRNPKLILKINFHDGLLSFKLTSAGRSAQYGPIGRHCVAGISKGHRGNSKFFLPLAS